MAHNWCIDDKYGVLTARDLSEAEAREQAQKLANDSGDKYFIYDVTIPDTSEMVSPVKLTFSQVVSSVVSSVEAQMRRCDSEHASSALIKRHTIKAIGSSEPNLVAPVIRAVRQELDERRFVNSSAFERIS